MHVAQLHAWLGDHLEMDDGSNCTSPTRHAETTVSQDDEKPEWHDFEWFAMLFTTGIAGEYAGCGICVHDLGYILTLTFPPVGLYFFGVAEPMYYYRTSYDQPLQKVLYVTRAHMTRTSCVCVRI